MKFQPDNPAGGVNAINRHDPGRIWVNGALHEYSVLVPWRGAVQVWPAAQLQDLTSEHFARVLDLKPELVIFGSGLRLRFISPALNRALIERGIGMETMDTAAACRTYNVLASEGRSVVAALLLEAGARAAG